MPESTRECPLCGGTMQLKRGQQVTQLPGNPRATVHQTAEWVCPDCEYFEDAEDALREDR